MQLSLLMSPFLSLHDVYSVLCNLAHNGLPLFIISYGFMCIIWCRAKKMANFPNWCFYIIIIVFCYPYNTDPLADVLKLFSDSH